MNERLRAGEHITPVQRADGRTVYRVRIDVPSEDGKRRQERFTYNSLKEARAALAAKRVQIAGGGYVRRDHTTVATYLDQWLAGKRSVRVTTIDQYRQALVPVTTRHGGLPLQRLSKAHLDTLVNDLLTTGGPHGQGRSARTVQLMLTVLSQALNAAVRQGLIPANPAALVERPHGTTAVGQAWAADQMRTFLTVASTERLAAGWRLGCLGLRRGEVLGLRWADVDLDAGVAHVRQSRVLLRSEVITQAPKTRKGARTVPLPAEVITDLRTLRRLQATERLAAGASYGDTQGLIVVHPNGCPVLPALWSAEFRRLTTLAGLPAIRLHDLRHSAASLLAAMNVPPVVAAALLGHDVSTYLATYVHPYADAKRDASELLAAAYR